MRHSIYYDFGATARVKLLSERGLTTKKFEEFHMGPILFQRRGHIQKKFYWKTQITITVSYTKPQKITAAGALYNSV